MSLAPWAGTHVEDPGLAAELSTLVNDAFAEVVATRHRFAALATLPLNDPRGSARELERAMTRLRLPGAMLFSNVNGMALADQRMWPLYEAANDLGAVLYIHPNHPISVEAMTEFWLMPLVGFLMDTTLAAAHLVFAGVPRRFPRIRWVLCHLGGAIPYLAERLDRGFHAFKECRRNIDRAPSEYLKRFTYDTISYNAEIKAYLVDLVGADLHRAVIVDRRLGLPLRLPEDEVALEAVGTKLRRNRRHESRCAPKTQELLRRAPVRVGQLGGEAVAWEGDGRTREAVHRVRVRWELVLREDDVPVAVPQVAPLPAGAGDLRSSGAMSASGAVADRRQPLRRGQLMTEADIDAEAADLRHG